MRQRLRTDGGVTLVEVVVAFVVFALGATAVAAVLATALHLSGNNRQRVQAAQIAADEIETTRAAISASAPVATGIATYTKTVGSTTFTVTRTVRWVGIAQSGSLCDSGQTTTPSYQRIDVAVSWTSKVGTPPVTANAIVTPPVGTLSKNSITIPVLVEGGALTGQSDITVTATPTSGGSTVTTTTDSDGCAVFANLTPGTYTIAVDTPGYVDTADVVAHSETDGSTTTGTTSVVRILYDQAASLGIGVVDPNGATIDTAIYPLPSNLPVVVVQSGSSAFPKSLHLTPSTPTATISGVFPFSQTGGAYSATAGTNACSTSSVSAATGSPAPAGSTTLNVPLDAVTAAFQNASGVPYGGATITSIASTSPCTSDSYTTFGAGGTHLTTSAAGTASFALPYGSYQVTLTTASGSSVTGTMALSATTPTVTVTTR